MKLASQDASLARFCGQRRIAARLLFALPAVCSILGCAAVHPLDVDLTFEHRLVAGRETSFPVLRVRNRWRRDVWVKGLGGALDLTLEYSVTDCTSGVVVAQRRAVNELESTYMARFREDGAVLLSAGSELGRFIRLTLLRDARYETRLHLDRVSFHVWGNGPSRQPDAWQELAGERVLSGQIPVSVKRELLHRNAAER